MARAKKLAKRRKADGRKTSVKKGGASKARSGSAKAKKGKRSGKYIFTFGGGRADGRSKMKNLLGGKGANLAEMASLGLPVPPGFTISTEVCTYFYDHGRTYPRELAGAVQQAVAKIERLMGKGFGDGANPLLVSVRSASTRRRWKVWPRRRATSASLTIPTAGSSRCTATSSSR
jgi:pyruvate,orthophosphate dikinase